MGSGFPFFFFSIPVCSVYPHSHVHEVMEILIYRALGHGELMGKMHSLIERVRKSSEYLQMEETALEDVRILYTVGPTYCHTHGVL